MFRWTGNPLTHKGMSMKTKQALRIAQSIVADGVRFQRDNIKSSRNTLATINAGELGITLVLMMLAEKLGEHGARLAGWVGAMGYKVRKPVLYISVDKVAGFTDPGVLRALEFLNNEFTAGRTSDYAASLGRCYHFERDDMKVEFTVYATQDGTATCRRVEDGEEVITQKKYRIVCE